MARGREEVRSFDYVGFPYEKVRAILKTDALAVFHSATRAAAYRTKSVASELGLEAGGIELGKELDLSVREIADRPAAGSTGAPATRMRIEWKATSDPGLFPLMKAELAAYPLTPAETQIDFSGSCEPPLGWLGTTVDPATGLRIAEASVERFVSEVANYLKGELDRTGSSAP